MPDHFHGLMVLSGGVSLGEVIGAFKSLVVRAVIAGVKRGDLARFPGKVWQRNYYEKIVRSESEWVAYEKYVRLNPARLVFEIDGMKAFGNPALWEYKKAGVLASGSDGIDAVPVMHPSWVWLSGFHSASEKSVLNQRAASCIRVAAVGPETVGLTERETAGLADGTLLVLCPFDAKRTTRENALKRNRFVAEQADRLWIPVARSGGSLAQLKIEFHDKLIQYE